MELNKVCSTTGTLYIILSMIVSLEYFCPLNSSMYRICGVIRKKCVKSRLNGYRGRNLGEGDIVVTALYHV